MLAADPDVLAYIHNNPPEQVPTIVAPIAAALREAWHGTVLVASVREVQVWLGGAGQDAAVHLGGRAVLPALTFARIFNPTYGPALTKALRALGSRLVNCPDAVALASTKFEAAAVLSAAGMPVPRQVLFASDPYPETLRAQAELGWPRVLKANTGRGGESVFKVAGPSDLLATATHDGPAQPWVAQQFRADAAGRDVRVLVIEGRVVAAMERHAATPGEFRANLALGAVARHTTLSSEEADIAVRATAALGLTIAGVDLLRTEEGPMLTEVNPSPALVGMAALVGDDVVYGNLATAVVRGL